MALCGGCAERSRRMKEWIDAKITRQLKRAAAYAKQAAGIQADAPVAADQEAPRKGAEPAGDARPAYRAEGVARDTRGEAGKEPAVRVLPAEGVPKVRAKRGASSKGRGSPRRE